MSDLFGVKGTALFDRLQLPAPYAARIASLRRLMDDLDFEIEVFTSAVQGRLRADPGYLAVQQIPGIGPVLGDLRRRGWRGHPVRQRASAGLWAGLTPKHHESDTHVRRGRITEQGSRLVRWAAVESVNVSAPIPVGALRDRTPSVGAAYRRGRGRSPAGRVRLLRAARRPRPRAPAPSTEAA